MTKFLDLCNRDGHVYVAADRIASVCASGRGSLIQLKGGNQLSVNEEPDVVMFLIDVAFGVAHIGKEDE